MYRTLALILMAALAIAACSGGTSAGGCGPIRTEPLASDWLIHVLPGGEAAYLSDPPTSGPHVAWEAPIVLDRQLSPAEQIGVLETGGILVQYRPADLDAASVAATAAEFERRADGRVRLAPNADLPSTVVLTGHLLKRSCPTIDLDAIEEFVARVPEADQQ